MSRFYSFRALPSGGWCEGVLLYGSRKSVDSSVLRTFFASNACLARDEPSSKRVGGIGLSRKPPKLKQAQPLLAKWHRRRALLPSCDTRCWQSEQGVRHADLRREATAVIAKPASALLYDTAVWYLVWVCGRVFCVG